MLGPCVFVILVDGLVVVVETHDRPVAYAALERHFRMMKGRKKRRRDEPDRRIVGELWQTYSDGSSSSLVCRINGPAPDLPGVKTSFMTGMKDVLVSFVE